MKNLSIVLLLLGIISNLTAQIQYEKRVELELRDGYSQEQIFEFENEVFLFRSVEVDLKAPQEAGNLNCTIMNWR